MTKFSYPGLLTALQYLTSVAGVWTLAKLGLLYHDPFNFQTAKKFAPAALAFYLAIFTNTYTSPEAKENNLCHGFHSNRRVVNKFLTVAINVMIWDKHASSIGLVCLLFTLAGGVLYQQSVTTKWNSPLPREAVAKQGNADNDTAELDEEKQKLGFFS
uniref:Sugar phosphate transporter domain-containing protein n=1 Tax=Oryza barthii TaxID=65489 RepID=A0A0D3GZI0_9ORYZ